MPKKYKVVTDKGAFIVETEDPSPALPQQSGGAVTSADSPMGALRNIAASGAEMLGFKPTIGGSVKGVGGTLEMLAHPFSMVGQGSQIPPGQEPDPLGDVRELYQSTIGRIVSGVHTKDPYEITGGAGASLPFYPVLSEGARLAKVKALRNAPDSLMTGAASIRSAVSDSATMPTSKAGLVKSAVRPVANMVASGMEKGAKVLSRNDVPTLRGPQFDYRVQAGPRQDIDLPENFSLGEPIARPTVDPVAHIEQALGPKGAERQALTLRIAPQLAEDPVFANIPPGPQFDRTIFDRFKAAQAELRAAGQSVPKGTTVAKKPLIDDILDLIEKQSSFASNPDLVANSRVMKFLGDWFNKLDTLPDQIPFEELRDFRQKLDQDIMSHGGWKETASNADRAEMQARRNLVNAIRRSLKGIDSRLDAADAAYGPAADAVTAAGLDWETGRRLATVGKTPKAKTPDAMRLEKVKRLRGGPL